MQAVYEGSLEVEDEGDQGELQGGAADDGVLAEGEPEDLEADLEAAQGAEAQQHPHHQASCTAKQSVFFLRQASFLWCSTHRWNSLHSAIG